MKNKASLKRRASRKRARDEKKEVKARRSLGLVFLVLLLLSLSFWLQGCQSKTMPPGMQVKVVRVLSGQTLEVKNIDTPKMTSSFSDSSLKVRLLGIDAPSKQQQPWGEAVFQRLAMIDGKNVMLEFDTQQQDSFGRHLAYVWEDGELLNEQLVKEGYALWSTRSPNLKYDRRLENAQAWAKLMGVGIWNPQKPMRVTPAEFRRLGAGD